MHMRKRVEAPVATLLLASIDLALFISSQHPGIGAFRRGLEAVGLLEEWGFMLLCAGVLLVAGLFRPASWVRSWSLAFNVFACASTYFVMLVYSPNVMRVSISFVVLFAAVASLALIYLEERERVCYQGRKERQRA